MQTIRTALTISQRIQDGDRQFHSAQNWTDAQRTKIVAMLNAQTRLSGFQIQINTDASIGVYPR